MFIPEATKLNLRMLNRKEKRTFSLLIAFVFVFNFIDMAAIASFIPFIDILSNLESMHKYSYLKKLYAFFGNPTHHHFCIITGGLSFALLVLKTFSLVFLNKFKVSFSNEVYERKSTEMLNHYLSVPYSYFLTHNTSSMLKAITKDINIVRSSMVVTINLAVGLISLVLVTGLLFFIEPYLFIFASLFGIVVIKFITALFKGRIYAAGEVGEKKFKEVFVKGKQSLEGVKDIILTGSKDSFVKTYRDSLHEYTISNIKGYLYKQNPGAYLELIAYSLFMFSVFYLINDRSNFQQAIPVLAALAMASKSIIPALNGVNSSLSELRLFLPVLNQIEALSKVPKRMELELIETRSVSFEKRIAFEKISYRYPNTSRDVIRDITVVIEKGSRLGLVGRSGSGKSTLMDVLLGLYEDFEGKIFVDDESVSSQNIQAFRSLVSYVPQNIFLLDAPVWENIAFGEASCDIERLEKALKTAKIYDLVQTFKSKENEIVGERGIKLSGGERQRIGIARAIYRNTPIIIFDESTSALDNQTEREFQENIDLLGRDKTIIVIAHRLTTVEKCDNILLMENGQIVESGTFPQLKHNSLRFQKFLHLAPSETAT